ncbi:MAG: hypothetical protein AAB573_00230 [Patescibacteria group bacterium]
MTDNDELKKRLKRVYGQQWIDLTPEVQDQVVAWSNKSLNNSPTTFPAIVSAMRNRSFEFGLFFLAAVIALLIGLLVNIVHDWFKGYEVIYPLVVVGLLVTSIFAIDRLFEESINVYYRDNQTLEKILNEINDSDLEPK